MPPQTEQGDFVMSAVLIPDLDRLEEMAEDGDVKIPVEPEDGRRTAGGDEGTDSTGPSGGGGGGGFAGPILGAELGSDVASGGGKGSGLAGGLLGGLSKMTVLLGAVVGLLLLLEPIQAALGGILRVLEIAIVPVVAALSPVIQGLTELVTQAVAFFRNPSKGLGKVIRRVVQSLGNALIGALNQIPGVNVKPLSLGDTGPGPAGSGIQTQGQGGAMADSQTDPDTFLDNFNPFTLEGQANLLQPGTKEIPALSDEANRQRRQDDGKWFEDLFGGGFSRTI